MTTILRRLRAVVTIALLWALFWLPIGLVLESLRDNATFDVVPPPLWWRVALFTTWGAINGSFFAIVLAVAERSRTLAELSQARVATWGAIGSLFLPATFVSIGMYQSRSVELNDWVFALVLLAICAVLGAGCAATTIVLARRAPRP